MDPTELYNINLLQHTVWSAKLSLESFLSSMTFFLHLNLHLFMVAWKDLLQLIFIHNSVKTYKLLLVFWLESIWLSLVAQKVENLNTVQEACVRFPRLGRWKIPMATHSSILAWRIPWTEVPGGLKSTKSHTWLSDWKQQQTQQLLVKKLFCARHRVIY